VLVSTLSIIYNVGKDEGNDAAQSQTLVSAVRDAKKDDGTPAWTPLTGLTLMVFFVLAYMTVIAYVGAFLTYHGGKALGLE
jgi:ferrous iron transport protein B